VQGPVSYFGYEFNLYNSYNYDAKVLVDPAPNYPIIARIVCKRGSERGRGEER
jgi:hypothetical protein